MLRDINSIAKARAFGNEKPVKYIGREISRLYNDFCSFDLLRHVWTDDGRLNKEEFEMEFETRYLCKSYKRHGELEENELRIEDPRLIIDWINDFGFVDVKTGKTVWRISDPFIKSVDSQGQDSEIIDSENYTTGDIDIDDFIKINE